MADERGLKWKHIDWMRNKVRLYGKKKERFVTLHSKLRELLLQRKVELRMNFLDIISFIASPTTHHI